ncbi:Uncharacterised protein [Salmonella enterica subsp. enterica]|uniref:Uncharacterized protein n=1 Tax=Salmonella enterica I TaxID=59201 RepID=A0A379Y320_SALET|nr:Uncharacterised protein [Salmonella enterica subsp. enterica]
MRSEAPSGRFFCLDEFHNHHMSDDVLRERLRSIDGIPGVSYQVNGENVFVFEKLVQLVKQNGHNLESALDLVPKATMTAAEAIEEWSVFPEPYSREINKIDHSQSIYHPYFNAYLPRKYPDRDTCNADAARLLLGNPVEGEGDFVYRGQTMVLRQPFTLDRLPPRPEWDVPVSEDPSAYTHLWNTNFVRGFAPVTESLFNNVKSAEWEWNHAIAATWTYMGNPECSASLWPRVGEFGLEQLELKSMDVDELDPEHHQQFQALYPELSMLSPAAIQKAYDEYCESMWEYPERCDGFLYHLIVSTVSSDMSRDTPEKTGRLIAHALLTGSSIKDACRFGSEAQQYDTALSGLAYQVAMAMKFVAGDSATEGNEGHPVITFSDSLRLMRKAKINSVTAKQNNHN